MEILAPLGILLAIAAIIILSVKGYSILVAAPLASVIVIVTNHIGISLP